MPLVRYKVTLEARERVLLQDIATRGKHSSQKVLNALILLRCDQGEHQERKLTNQEIAEVLPVSMKKIDRVKKRFVEQGIEAALDKQKAQRTFTRKTDGDFEAHLVALSCTKAPEGHARWSLRLLADRVVELNYIDSISYETVRTILKKRNKAVAKRAMGDPARA
jgi:transposase